MTRLRAEQIVGGWSLVRWEIVYDAGARRTQPFGENATGLITYTPDGWMSATIMASGRQPFATANPRDASVEERARAYDSYFSYAGRWRIDGRRVVHDVSIALNPAMVGTPQVRDARCAGRTLELSALERTRDGGTRLHRLLWKRVKAARRKPAP
jgi:hypothetical protein